MRDINEAWRVLSDPDRRRRYDLEVGGGQVAPVRAPSPPVRPRPGPVRAAGTPESPRPGGPTVPTVGASGPTAGLGALFVSSLPYLVVFGILATIFVATAYALDESGTAPNPPTGREDQSVNPLGQCVAFLIPQGTIYVPCSGPHQGRIVELAPLGRPCPEGASARYLSDLRRNLCLAPS